MSSVVGFAVSTMLLEILFLICQSYTKLVVVVSSCVVSGGDMFHSEITSLKITTKLETATTATTVGRNTRSFMRPVSRIAIQ